jgi:hypothetical protein
MQKWIKLLNCEYDGRPSFSGIFCINVNHMNLVCCVSVVTSNLSMIFKKWQVCYKRRNIVTGALNTCLLIVL